MNEAYGKPKRSIGSTIFTLGIVAIVLIIGSIILFGFVWSDFDPLSYIVNIIGVILMIFLLSLAIKGLVSFLKPKPFSPTEDFRTALIRLAKKSKPFNVKNLYLRGEDMRTYAKWGKIIGLGFLPYLASSPIRDKKGMPEFERDAKGEIIYEKNWSNSEREYIETPKIKYKMLSQNDGDVLFITERHAFPLNLFFRDLDIIRANPKYCSDLLGDIFIKDVNLVPYGEFLYPAKQWQNDIIQIMKENEATTIATTHRNNLDLVSNVTQMSLGSDPTFQKIMMVRSENISSGLTNTTEN